MRSIYLKIFFFVLTLQISQSCIPKSERIIRREFYNQKNKLSFSADYVGTQNQSVIYFYNNNKFYVNNSCIFSLSHWQSGTWLKNNDTICVTFSPPKNKSIFDKMLIDSNYLYVKKTINNSFKYIPMYKIVKPEMGKTINLE